MSSSPEPAQEGAGILAKMHKLYNPIGFNKRYNFILWSIFAGAMFGFCLARMMYLDFYGVFCSPVPKGNNHAAPGECYWYTTYDVYRAGIKMHLYAVIPAGVLACVQFVPVVRHKLILLHRINGYVTLMLSLVGVAGAIMIAPVAFGGDLAIQGVAGVVVTARIIMILAAIVISSGVGKDAHHQPKLCRELASLPDSTTLLRAYPDCASLDAWVLVTADMTKGPEQKAAAMNVSFGMAVWLATTIHAIGIEAYLQLTPGETRRLREISRQRQAEAKLKAASETGLSDGYRRNVERVLKLYQ